MTSAPVANRMNFLNHTTNAETLNVSKSESLSQTFTQAMGSAATSYQNQSQTKAVQTAENGKNDKSADTATKSVNTTTKDKQVTANKTSDRSVNKTLKNKQTEKTEVPEEAKSELAAKAEKLVSEVADELNVSEDEVKEAMELLGIQAIDLLNPDNMAQLVVELSGETDMMSLVMDEDLYGSLKELLASAESMVKDVQQEYQLTPEVMSQFVEESQQPQSDISVENTNPDIQNVSEKQPDTQETSTTVQTDKEPVITVEVDQKVQVQEKVPNQEQATESTKLDADTKESIDVETTDVEETIEKPLGTTTQHGTTESKSGNESHAESGQTFLQGMVEQAAKAAENAVSSATQTTFASAFETQNTESIMKQMLDYMKIHVGTNVTEMEMQLQPASLGTINLQIASKSGVITAHFTAQNEGVKEALEAQIVQLKESLEERGVKVEAVEVSVASHEFERNLQQNGEREARENEQAGTIRKATRHRLTLEEAMAEDELEESEKIQVEMMQQSGNSVNFMA